MLWLRRVFVGLLSIILLIALIDLAVDSSLAINFASPKKLEGWLVKSKVYDDLGTALLKQSTNDNSLGSISLSDPGVQQAAQQAFSADLFQKNANSLLEGNYAWLRGQTKTPTFTLDFTSAQQDFAKFIGQAAEDHLASLNVCSTAQLEQIQIPADPLTVACRPATIDPKTEGDRLAQEIRDNSNFFNNPVITASNIDQLGKNGSSNVKPYYQRNTLAPKAYKLMVYMPFALLGLSLLLILGIIFISPTRRKGVRRVGVIMTEAGIVLVAAWFLADNLTNRYVLKAVNKGTAVELKQPLTVLIHEVESNLTRIQLIFGVIFLIAGLLILVQIFRSRDKKAKPESFVHPKDRAETAAEKPEPSVDSPPLANASDLRLARPRSEPPTASTPSQTGSERSTAPPMKGLGKNPPKRKPPRLIQ